MSLLRLSRRKSWRKDAEILMLRHQLAVAERERPKARAWLAWPDRAWPALLAGTLPAGRLAGMRLLVTAGTILRWHRDIVRRRRGHLSRRGRSGRPATHRRVRSVVLRLAGERVLGLPADPRRARGAGHHRGAIHGLGDPQERRDRPGAAPRRSRMGRVPAITDTGDLGPGLLYRRPPQRRQGARPCRDRARYPPRPDPGRPRSIPSRRGSCSRPGTCSWTSRTPGRGSSS